MVMVSPERTASTSPSSRRSSRVRGPAAVAAVPRSVQRSELVRVTPDGTATTLLGSADGLQNPTSVAVRGDVAYVLSAAYTTATDPNLVLAALRCP